MYSGLEKSPCAENCSADSKTEELQERLPDMEELFELADFFKIFGDSTRLKILCALEDEPMCVCDIAAVLDISQSAVSHQLRYLKQMRLLDARREGKQIFYSLKDEHINSIIGQGLEHIRE